MLIALRLLAGEIADGRVVTYEACAKSFLLTHASAINIHITEKSCRQERIFLRAGMRGVFGAKIGFLEDNNGWHCWLSGRVRSRLAGR